MDSFSLRHLVWALPAATIVLCATAFGIRILSLLKLVDSMNRALAAAFAGALGLMVLSLLTFLFSLLHFMPLWLFVLIPAVMLTIGFAPMLRTFSNVTTPDGPTAAVGVVLAILVIASLGGVTTPPADYDDLEYHLVLPKEYAEHGGYVRLDDWNVYTTFPQNVEMLTLYGMVLTDSISDGVVMGRLFNLMMALLLALGVYGALKDLTSSRMAALAAGLAVVLPSTMVLIAYRCSTEICQSLCSWLAGAAAIWIVAGAVNPRREWAMALLGGLMAGFASGAKYPSIIFCAVPVAVMLLVMGRFRAWMVFTAAALAAFSPWAIRGIIEQSNPVFPLAYGIFPSVYWTAEEAARFSGFHDPPPWSIAESAKLWLADVKTKFSLNPLLLILPLAVLTSIGKMARGKRRVLVVLAGVVAVYLAVWIFATHRYIRFLFPLYPWLAALSALALHEGSKGLSRVGSICSWISVAGMTLMIGLYGFGAYQLRMQKRDGEIVAQGAPDMMALTIVNEASEDRKAKVLLLGEARTFPLTREYIAATIFNRNPLLERMEAGATPEAVIEWMRSQGVAYVLVNWSEVERLRKEFPEPLKVLTTDSFAELGLQRIYTSRDPNNPEPVRNLKHPTEIYALPP